MHYKADGTLDMRYSSSKAFVASGGSPFGPSCSSSTINYSSRVLSSPAKMSQQTNENLHYKRDNTLDMRYSSSKAFVASGGSPFGPNCSSSTMNNNSNSSHSPAKEIPHLKKDGTPDMRYSSSKALNKMKSEAQKSPKIKASDIRDPYEQKKYREKSRSTQKDKKDVCHIIDLEVAAKCLQSKPGPKLDLKELKEQMKPINQKYRMRLTETNQGFDRDMAKRICKLLDGEDMMITRNLEKKINQMVKNIDSISKEDKNPSINWISKKLHEIQDKHCISSTS